MSPLEFLVNQTVSFAFALWPQPTPPPQKLKDCRLVAHRGVHEGGLAIENTRQALDLCVQNQIWGAEFDVRFTKDHEPIVSHDPDGGRLWRRPDIRFSEQTFADVRRALPEVMHLQEVVEQFAKKLHLMIEIKENLAGQANRIENLKKILVNLSPGEDYHLLSLTPHFLEPLEFCTKKAFLDVIWTDAATVLKANRELGHGAIAGHFLLLPKIGELKRQGVKVAVGFLDSKNSLYREINRDVDFVFTNHPLRLKKILEAANRTPGGAASNDN